MINQKYLVVFAYLRQNARLKLSKISRKTGIAISTIHDQLKAQKDNLIKKYTTLLDFEKLGYNAKLSFAISVSPDDKQKLRDFLLKNHKINSLYAINNGFDFLAEGIFKQIREAEQFVEKIEQEFEIKDKEVHYIVDELKQETFLSNPYIPYSS